LALTQGNHVEPLAGLSVDFLTEPLKHTGGIGTRREDEDDRVRARRIGKYFLELKWHAPDKLVPHTISYEIFACKHEFFAPKHFEQHETLERIDTRLPASWEFFSLRIRPFEKGWPFTQTIHYVLHKSMVLNLNICTYGFFFKSNFFHFKNSNLGFWGVFFPSLN
jgi:hypothetical protein